MSFFPPTPSYPLAIDDDYSLFKVYDTSETITTADNPAWSQEIAIQPAITNEVWASNGFGNINGELFYYDGVTLDESGFVSTFNRVLRNIGGNPTTFNPAGTDVRGFVVAEHHSQLSQAVQQIEQFVGTISSTDPTSLTYRINNLLNQPIIFDDFSCPDVVFNFTTLSQNANTGTVISYLVQAQGNVGSIQIQFGDGSSSNVASGTHTYAPNATIDPVVLVSNKSCQVAQTPDTRVTEIGEDPSLPTLPIPVPPFFIPVPIVPPFPLFTIPDTPIPEIDLFIPPIVLPPCNAMSCCPFPISATKCISVCWGNPPLLSVVCPCGTNSYGLGPSDDDLEVHYDTFGFQNDETRFSLESPKSVKLDTSQGISLEIPKELPNISIDTSGIPKSIPVVGIPDFIQVVGLPSIVNTSFPSKIPLVYEGPPISTEVRVVIDIQKIMSDNEDDIGSCVRIIPCKK